MQAFLAILRYDVAQLARSWLVRLWVVLLVAVAAFLVVLSSTEEAEQASEILAFYVLVVLAPVSGVAVALIAAQTVSGERAVIADSILSRSVTRTEYLSAKIVARLGTAVGVYIAVMVPFSYLVIRYGTSDVTAGGLVAGLLMVGGLLAFVAALGVTLSTLLNNALLVALVLMLLVLFSGALTQFLGLEWMSATAVLYGLADTFRGDTPFWDELRVLLIFPLLTAAAVFGSLWSFRRRDL